MITVEMILYRGDDKEKLRFFIDNKEDLGNFVKCLCGFTEKLYLEIYQNK